MGHYCFQGHCKSLTLLTLHENFLQKQNMNLNPKVCLQFLLENQEKKDAKHSQNVSGIFLFDITLKRRTITTPLSGMPVSEASLTPRFN